MDRALESMRFVSRNAQAKAWDVKLPSAVQEDADSPRKASFYDKDYGGESASRAEALQYRDDRWSLTGLPLHAPIRKPVEAKMVSRTVNGRTTYDWVAMFSVKLESGRISRRRFSRSVQMYGDDGKALVERLVREALSEEATNRSHSYVRRRVERDAQVAGLANALRRLRKITESLLTPGLSVDLGFVDDALQSAGCVVDGQSNLAVKGRTTS